MSFDPLKSCIELLRGSVGILEGAITALDSTSHDMTRLSTVLYRKSFFQVTPQCDVEDIKKSLEAEVVPKINSAMGKLELEIARLGRKRTNLANRAALQQTRIENRRGGKASDKVRRLRDLRLKKKALQAQLQAA